MNRWGALLVVVTTACSSSPGERTDVDVRAFRHVVDHDTGAATIAPREGVLVVFADVDGTSRTATVDANGHAGGAVEIGGSVWLAEIVEAPGSESADLVAYADIRAGASLRFGPEPISEVATMAFTATPPVGPFGGAGFFEVYSSCSDLSLARGVTSVAFDDRCDTTADVLLVALENDSSRIMYSHPYAYAYRPQQALVDGATVTIDASEWKAFERPAIELAGALGWYDVGNLRIESAYRAPTVPNSATVVDRTFSSPLPLVGSLFIRGSLTAPAVHNMQSFVVRLPAVAAQSTSLDAALAPWAVVEGRRWSLDTTAGFGDANAIVQQQLWLKPVANYQANVRARVITPPSSQGALENVELPDALATYQAGDDFQVTRLVHSVRAVGNGIDPLRVAELATSLGVDSQWIMDGVDSVAVSYGQMAP